MTNGTHETPGTRRTIVIMRHAKSDWGTGEPDVERPLSTRGQADAPVAGRWLRDNVGRPDLVLVSPARRTRQTWQAVHSVTGYDTPVRYEPSIYLAEASALLGLLTAVDDTVHTVMLVGHNPGSADLVEMLAGEGSPQAFAQLHAKFPTSAVAVLTYTGSWSALGPATAELIDVAVPRAAPAD